MKLLLLAMVLALAGCSESDRAPKSPAADAAAGRAFAERECKGCHGLDGKGAAPAIPHLAAQRESYLLASLRAYKEGKRIHAALKEIAAHMSDADARNLAAFYAGLPPVKASITDSKTLSPYDRGKELASACAKCHGQDGNSATPGIPNLAGQQPHYLVVAIQEYLAKERKAAPMHALLPGLSRLEKESLALYFASQTPQARSAPPVGDPAAGEPLSAVCGGCHGSHGVSIDTATPILAGQDAQYLVQAIKAYRTTRQRETMRAYVQKLSDREIENIAAFYSVQKSRPAEKGLTLVQELTDKCNRCHGAQTENPALPIPKLGGQDRDYLVMALRAYRDDRRESTAMHKMSLPYGDAVIDSIASYYAAQPAK
ncbi:MAG TPA: c-type cytochrome [Burkholderiales bacterium]|nr:c-type cytochrome [Burkholderiales bacterium]